MDSTGQVDISKLSENDKQELNQFITSEAQKSSIQQSTLFLPSVGSVSSFSFAGVIIEVESN